MRKYTFLFCFFVCQFVYANTGFELKNGADVLNCIGIAAKSGEATGTQFANWDTEPEFNSSPFDLFFGGWIDTLGNLNMIYWDINNDYANPPHPERPKPLYQISCLPGDGEFPCYINQETDQVSVRFVKLLNYTSGDWTPVETTLTVATVVEGKVYCSF